MSLENKGVLSTEITMGYVDNYYLQCSECQRSFHVTHKPLKRDRTLPIFCPFCGEN